jgi:hypothetical protein
MKVVDDEHKAPAGGPRFNNRSAVIYGLHTLGVASGAVMADHRGTDDVGSPPSPVSPDNLPRVLTLKSGRSTRRRSFLYVSFFGTNVPGGGS